MQLLRSPEKLAGVLSLLCAGLMLPFWYILLFTATPSGMSSFEGAIQQLQFSFSPETPGRWLLVWWAAMPFACLGIGVAYLLNGASTKRRAIGLTAASATLVLAAIVLSNWPTAAFLALPVVFGAQCVRRA